MSRFLHRRLASLAAGFALALLPVAAPAQSLGPTSYMYLDASNATLPQALLNLKAVPHVATNAALAAAANAAYPNGVIRDDYAAGTGAPPLFFSPQSGTCAANSLTNDGGSCTDGAGGNSWLPHSNGVYDIRQFGAKGDGTGDQSGAINAAAAAIRKAGLGGTKYKTALFVGDGRYRITGPLNLTCLSALQSGTNCGNIGDNDSGQFDLVGQGGIIVCATSGAPCLDGMGSRFVRLLGNLEIIGACDGTEPSYGLQHGRVADAIHAPFWDIVGLTTTGCFTKAPYYNNGAEQTRLYYPRLLNADAAGGGGSYGAILDHGNHWAITSSFVTVAMAVDSTNAGNSFDALMISGGGQIGAAGASSTSGGMWIWGTTGLRIGHGSFVKTNGPACFVWWTNSTGTTGDIPIDPDIDAHCESYAGGSWARHQLQSKTAATSWTVRGFADHDLDVASTNYVISKDGNTNLVALLDERLRYPYSSGSPALLDVPASYRIGNPDTDYVVSNITGWTPTVACNTGAGSTGTCTNHSTNNTPGKGNIVITPGGTGIGSAGAVDVTWSFLIGNSSISCQAWLSNSTGVWDTGATLTVTDSARTTMRIFWKNAAVTLTSGSAYWINYRCSGVG